MKAHSYNCTLSLTYTIDGGWWSTPGFVRLTPGNDPVPIVQWAEWGTRLFRTGMEYVAHIGFQFRTLQPIVNRYND